MINEAGIRKLLAAPEGQTLAFRRDLSSPKLLLWALESLAGLEVLIGA